MPVVRKCVSILVFLQVCLLLAGHAWAQSAKDDQWSVSITPYCWLAKLEGRTATLPPLPSLDVNLNAGDILENLDMAFMAVIEVRKGRWGVFGDVVYSRLSTDGDAPHGILFSKIEMETTNLIVTGGGSFRAISKPGGFLDIIAGGRYWSIDTELELKGRLLRNRSQHHYENWVDPFVGIKGRVELGRGVFLSGWSSIGGFGAASRFSYDVYGGLGYAFNKTVAATLGYRALYVDYEHNDFLYDVTQRGPIMGLSFHF